LSKGAANRRREFQRAWNEAMLAPLFLNGQTVCGNTIENQPVRSSNFLRANDGLSGLEQKPVVWSMSYTPRLLCLAHCGHTDFKKICGIGTTVWTDTDLSLLYRISSRPFRLQCGVNLGSGEPRSELLRTGGAHRALAGTSCLGSRLSSPNHITRPLSISSRSA
jgi:hypothetical protein